MKNFGVDVSKWQGNFNFNLAKQEGVNFAIIRAAYHKSKDVEFEDNYKKALDAGIHVGAYIYAMDKTPEQAKETAQWLALNCLAGKQFDYPIYYDVEDSEILALGTKPLTAIVKSFCSTLEKLGYFVGIYGSLSKFNVLLNEPTLDCFTHWVAAWRETLPTLQNGVRVDMWQFGGETNIIRTCKVAGVTCDQNYSFVDFPAIIINAKLNGYGKDIKIPTKNSIVRGSKVIVIKAVDYAGKHFNVYYPKYTVLQVKKSRVIIGIDNIVTCAINIKNLKLTD